MFAFPYNEVAMPLEKNIVAAVMRAAESLGWLPYKIHGGPYQTAGIPDVLCLRAGRAVWLEVKRPGKEPTEIQKRRMNELETRGGTPCHVVTSKEEACAVLRVHASSAGWGADNPPVDRRVGG